MALNYYILPTNIHNKLQIKPPLSTMVINSPGELKTGIVYHNMAQLNNIPPCISQSYCIYYAQLKNQFITTPRVDKDDPMTSNNIDAAEEGQVKMRMNGTTFYDMVEVLTTLNILSIFANMASIKAIHIGNKYTDNYQYLSYLRNNQSDKHFYFYENIGHSHDYLFHYIFYDLEQGTPGCNIHDINVKTYTIQFIKAVMFILKNQLEGGVCVIKLTHLIHKPILDLVYILLAVYEKASIIRPSTVNALSHNKYLVCKGFVNKHALEYHAKLQQWLQSVLVIIDTVCITNAVDILSPLDSLPLYFLNKITDINTVLGHKQLDSTFIDTNNNSR